jgi:tripartite-type tricarboxylate transporter receptor subunit TctC
MRAEMRDRSLDLHPLKPLALAAVFACAVWSGFASAQAEAYPARAVKIMVGASVGGGTDVIARVLADKLADSLKQAFVVENRPGASNTIAADITAKAPADGHTLLLATNTAQSIAPHLLKLAYDPLKDLQPVGLVVVVPNVLVVNQTVPAKDIGELVALLKRRPGELRYASVGVGSTQHIAAEAFKLATGTQIIHIPYKGSSQAHVDLLGGSVEMMIDTTSSAMAQIKAGRLRPLAVASASRSPELPAVPTFTESGVSGADMATWYGLFVTGGTPRPIVEKLHVQLLRILRLPDVDARLRGLGGAPGTLTLDQFAEMNRADFERSGALIRKANIQPDG